MSQVIVMSERRRCRRPRRTAIPSRKTLELMGGLDRCFVGDVEHSGAGGGAAYRRPRDEGGLSFESGHARSSALDLVEVQHRGEVLVELVVAGRPSSSRP